MTAGLLSDQEIISTVKYIHPAAFLAADQIPERTEVVLSILASGHNVAIIHWNDGAKAFVPIDRGESTLSDELLIKVYRMFHEKLKNNPDIKGRVWEKI